jgi:multicomponent Na+:H+ antiporter subunit E
MSERLTLWSVLTGIVVSTLCVILFRRFLPLERIKGIRYSWFLLYIVYLIGQMYRAAAAAMKLIIVGARADVVEIETTISNDFLKVMLANSITIVPGSVTLDVNDNRLTVLMLRGKSNESRDLREDGELMKSGLEKRLSKAQR